MLKRRKSKIQKYKYSEFKAKIHVTKEIEEVY